MRPLIVEIDTSPALYLSTSEYTGLFVARQLHRPLFAESIDAIVPDLLAVVDRPAPNTWVFGIDPRARWSDGDQVSAAEVGAHLANTTTDRRWAWLSHVLRRIEVIDKRTLTITTRIPVAMLDAVLSNPAFSPRRPEAVTGAFSISTRSTATVELMPARRFRGRPVTLVTTACREDGREAFRRGDIDLGWGVGVPTDFWSPTDRGPFVGSGRLDIHVVLCAGRDVPPPAAGHILSLCRLAPHDVPGVVASQSRFDEGPSPEASIEPAASPRGARDRPLFYSAFPPNREIAEVLAARSGGLLRPVQVSYTTMRTASWPAIGFGLQLHATAFPDAVGRLVETATMAVGRRGAGDAYRDVAGQAWAASSPDSRLRALRELEPFTDRISNRRVLGRLVARFRSATQVHVPRTGWLDLTQLT